MLQMNRFVLKLQIQSLLFFVYKKEVISGSVQSTEKGFVE